MKIISLLLLFIVGCMPAFAQENMQATDVNNNAGLLHQNGQIYLVVLVLLTIFAGIIFYLVRLERKISRLEKK
jgi:hypothetical protein